MPYNGPAPAGPMPEPSPAPPPPRYTAEQLAAMRRAYDRLMTGEYKGEAIVGRDRPIGVWSLIKSWAIWSMLFG